MNEKSWRHHYLPEFYLKGFTNDKGQFKIFDVQKDRFIKNGKWFSPESYFFEKHGNSIESLEGKEDFLEVKFYKDLDQQTANLFEKINSSKPNTGFGLTDSDMPFLQLFIGTLYWRLPLNYAEIVDLLKNKELKELGLILKTQNRERIRKDELENKIKNDSDFTKAMKFLLPHITYLRILDCDTPLAIQKVPKGLPALISDYPIIFENSTKPDVFKDDFIFPLKDDHLFMRSKKINTVESNIKAEIDLIILKQATKYVSCTDESYIKMLNKYYNQNYDSIDELKKSVFKKLFY